MSDVTEHIRANKERMTIYLQFFFSKKDSIIRYVGCHAKLHGSTDKKKKRKERFSLITFFPVMIININTRYYKLQIAEYL